MPNIADLRAALEAATFQELFDHWSDNHAIGNGRMEIFDWVAAETCRILGVEGSFENSGIAVVSAGADFLTRPRKELQYTINVTYFSRHLLIISLSPNTLRIMAVLWQIDDKSYVINNSDVFIYGSKKED